MVLMADLDLLHELLVLSERLGPNAARATVPSLDVLAAS